MQKNRETKQLFTETLLISRALAIKRVQNPNNKGIVKIRIGPVTLRAISTVTVCAAVNIAGEGRSEKIIRKLQVK